MKIAFLFLLLVFFVSRSFSQSTNEFSPEFVSSVRKMHDLMATTPAYRQAALSLVLAEANKVAQELHLPESLPITETNLTASYLSPPRMAPRLGAIGNITTANYTYYCSVGYKFSYLVRVGLEQDYAKLRKESLLPMSQMDTNAAYQMAVQFLAAAKMDVSALNRDCKVHIMPFTPEGSQGKHFVPVYWVYWSKPEQAGRGSTASVELFTPTKMLRQLRVEDSQYILREPLGVTNLDYLLSQTNGVGGTNALRAP
jgi:hypothetical protein